MKLLLMILVVALIVAQFVPVDLTNPPTDDGMRITAPEPVMDILQRACFDCHSHETVWPWYARVAPMSWLVEHDVLEGRDHMNLSEWGAWSDDRRAHKAEDAWLARDAGFGAVWASEVLFKFGGFSGRHFKVASSARDATRVLGRRTSCPCPRGSSGSSATRRSTRASPRTQLLMPWRLSLASRRLCSSC